MTDTTHTSDEYRASLSIGKLSGSVKGNVMNIHIQDSTGLFLRARVNAEDLMLALTGCAEVPLNITSFKIGTVL